MSWAFAYCQHRDNLSLRSERQKMTSSFHCDLAAPKGFNMILQAELCCCYLPRGLSETEHNFMGRGRGGGGGGGVSPRCK